MVSRASTRKNFLSEFAHVSLNIALVVATFLLVYVGGRVELALLLVPLSKWRVFAVRPRFWVANLLSNIVDITVSCGLVIMMYLASTSGILPFELQVGFALLYAAWLIAIKPRTSHKWVVAQAGIALFIGVAAVSAVNYLLPLWVSVIGYFAIGYGAARHVLSQYKEPQYSLFSMVFGLVLAELCWVAYHWTVAYGVPVMGELKLAQVAIFAVLLGLVMYQFYRVARDGKSFRSPEVVVPTVFSVLVTIVLLVFFTTLGSGIM
jgi:hypothetical protein